MQSNPTKSIPALLGDTVELLGRHLRSEVQLAKAEMSETIAKAEQGLVLVLIAGVLIIPAFVLLLLAFAMWLIQMGMTPVLSYVLAAGIGACLSVAFGLSGLSRLKAKNLKLTRTAQQIDKDKVAARTVTK